MAKAKIYTGGCLCGAVRFEAEGPPLKPHTCSCKMCQRHSGALTTAWVEFPKDKVRWTGKAGAPALYKSSQITRRAFCAKCGSTLGAVDVAPTAGLLLGVFDKAHLKELAPRYHSYRGGRPNWWSVAIEGF
jgi:hypothetical protein